MQHEHSKSCQHNKNSSSYEQTLEEIEFEKSIFNACVQGDLNRIKYLIDKKGASQLFEQDRNGYSCLHYAARHNHFEICKFLVSNRIDVNLKTKSCQSTALHRAAYMGNCEIVKLLVENGSSVFEKDCDGKTCLHKCVEQIKQFEFNESKLKKYLDTMNFIVHKEPELINEKDNLNKKPSDYFPEILNYLK